ncbi:hypothetical protein XENOCAPTIV_028508 [Xenoophorus captivus]|uniref:Uncharacterized protein n=1 Tax=Xenoophorus captivus TaxID=1517983 RepID=A0ABV0R722_9TELE
MTPYISSRVAVVHSKAKKYACFGPRQKALGVIPTRHVLVTGIQELKAKIKSRTISMVINHFQEKPEKVSRLFFSNLKQECSLAPPNLLLYTANQLTKSGLLHIFLTRYLAVCKYVLL